jgi:hypothetical protein
MRRVIGLLALMALGSAALAPGQGAGTAGMLRGRAVDPSGAALVGVAVTVSDENTGQEKTALTGPDGDYSILSLTPGWYKVKFALSGFKTLVYSHSYLSARQTLALNAPMEFSSAQRSVVVHRSPAPGARVPEPASEGSTEPEPSANEPACDVQLALSQGARLRLAARTAIVIPNVLELGRDSAALLAPNLLFLRSDRRSLTLRYSDSGMTLTVPRPGRVLHGALVSLGEDTVSVELEGSREAQRIPFAAIESAQLWDNGDERWLDIPLGPVSVSPDGMRFTGDAHISRTPVAPVTVVALRLGATVSIEARSVAGRAPTDERRDTCAPSPLGVSTVVQGTGQPLLVCPGLHDPVRGILVALASDRWRVRRPDVGDVVEVPRGVGIGARARCGATWLPLADDARIVP